ncbi:hypothetical protein KDL44_12595 [bacterium]|nr:hypothetical protein [bacterium]
MADELGIRDAGEMNELLLELQSALLGNVTANLRMVSANALEDLWEVHAFFDGPIAEEDKENMSLVESELWAAARPSQRIIMKIIRLDHPNPLPQDHQRAYRRQELQDL